MTKAASKHSDAALVYCKPSAVHFGYFQRNFQLRW